MIKSLEITFTGTIGHKTNSYWKKDKKLIVPWLGPEKVENHCDRGDNPIK